MFDLNQFVASIVENSKLDTVLVKNGASVERHEFARLLKIFASRVSEEHASLPGEGQTFAIAMHNLKTTALFFDRVWSYPGSDDDVPDDIA